MFYVTEQLPHHGMSFARLAPIASGIRRHLVAVWFDYIEAQALEFDELVAGTF